VCFVLWFTVISYISSGANIFWVVEYLHNRRWLIWGLGFLAFSMLPPAFCPILYYTSSEQCYFLLSPPPLQTGSCVLPFFELHIFFFLLFDSGDTPLPCSYDMRVSRTFVSFHFPLNEMEGGWRREGHTARRRSYGYCSFVPFSFTFFRKNNSMNEKTIRFFFFFSFLYGVVPVFCYACLLISTYVL